MTATNGLPLWVIYDHPRDFPDAFVVRCQTVDGTGVTIAPCARLFPSLARARAWLAQQGLTCLAREPEDDPVIVETWL